MGLLKKLSLLSLALVLACAPSFKEEKQTRDILGSTLEGDFLSADKKMSSLATDNKKVVVLQFASDTCMVCISEVAVLKQQMKSGIPPKGIRFISLLVGAIPEDAEDWVKQWKVPWEVGIDPDLKLFRRYCRENTVPCLVISRPNVGVVYSHHGALDISEVMKVTGPWGEP